MSHYLTDLADVVRAAGLLCHEEYGWQTRARSSGGYDDGRPDHVMVHHTASGPNMDGQPDVDYIRSGSSIAPMSNLYLGRTGEVWVIAGGATNTNGDGHDWWGGGVPDNSMNVHAIGIEAGNNGIGEPWPDVEQDAYLQLVGALCDHYGIPVSHVRAHAEWAPSRKIDPAGPSRFGIVNSSQTWNMDIFRDDVYSTPAPQPPGTGGIYDPMFCQDDTTEDFWIVTTDWEGQWAAPINEIPQIDWRLIGPVNDIVNGALKRVPHAYLQAIYDVRGRPATP